MFVKNFVADLPSSFCDLPNILVCALCIRANLFLLGLGKVYRFYHNFEYFFLPNGSFDLVPISSVVVQVLLDAYPGIFIHAPTNLYGYFFALS